MRSRGLVLACALTWGCGRTTLVSTGELDESEDAVSDTALDDDADGASEDADSWDGELDGARPVGSCEFDGYRIPCFAGEVCRANFVVGPNRVICTRSGDPWVPCGRVGCGEYCYCVDETKSVCHCD